MRVFASPAVGPEADPAFERFVVGHSRLLLRSAYLLCGDRGLAEDLLQQTLLRMAGRWQVARQAPEAYAHRVLVNLSRDLRRRVRRRPLESPLSDARAYVVDRDHADGTVQRDAVIRALRRLPAGQREVLVLRFYADLSVAETAAAIDASEGTVKSATSRALARMRELLADPDDRLGQKPAEVSSDER